ncbi:Peptidoglycan/xylan/chitin deacetylase, PgdA/CDA1 family [Mesobacillus persicus]|uniref:Peptidoglycan/xylan/chitin deacetylase, PgdA/CDA1 family n=1 Tax=Mesobacillus persicus TaxID=930146 RepID=A0A1H7VTW5_9BACI|nr:polysaccharide deacetylase family protein [Mesobacillus persicus]SEM12208.1 Peptidoglycan/xylan/chitin deacetylase, PgdA/CDA1 family [Mesobacillus persicus]
MKCHLNKLVYKGLIIFLMMSLIPPNVLAEESMLPEAPIYIDDEPINTKYLMRNNHLLVPALFFKHSGALVDWDKEYQSVVFQAKEKKIALPVGKKFTDEYVRANNTWKRGTLTTEAIEFKGQIFVPLVDVAEKLGMIVRYDQELNRTFITSNITVRPNSIKKGNTSKKLVALTFDDGPEAFYTPQILDILKTKGVPATFFVMGQKLRSHPEIMQRIVNEGHAIGNHTFNHPDLRKQWSSTVREEIIKTQQEMIQVIGRKPDVFRPPYGAVTKADVKILNDLWMRNIMWSVDTLDWSGASAEQILEIVNNKTTPGGIVLQHNFQEGRLLDGSVKALPQIIDDLQKRGYQFVTIQTLLAQ